MATAIIPYLFDSGKSSSSTTTTYTPTEDTAADAATETPAEDAEKENASDDEQEMASRQATILTGGQGLSGAPDLGKSTLSGYKQTLG